MSKRTKINDKVYWVPLEEEIFDFDRAQCRGWSSDVTFSDSNSFSVSTVEYLYDDQDEGAPDEHSKYSGSVADEDASKSGDRKGMQLYEVGDGLKTDNFNCRGTNLASLDRHSTKMVSTVAGGNMQKAAIFNNKTGI